MPDRVRVGVIGTSGFADYMHLTDLKSHPRAQLTAICGRSNSERAAELAATHGIPNVFTDYHEMIEKAPLDAIVVAAPDDLHYPIVMEALDAGLHVLCEKPLASNAAQARAMYEKAEAAGVRHMVFFTWPWLKHYQQLNQLLAEGCVGQTRVCSVTYLGDHGLGGAYNWRWDARRANGILGDLGAHAIQFARLYVGEIARVSADLHACSERADAEGRPALPANDTAVLVVEFVNGAHGTIQLSGVANLANEGMQQRITLYGDLGSLESEVTFARRSLRGARSGAGKFETFVSHLFGPDDGEVGGIFDMFRTESVGDRLFIDAILEDRPVTPSFYDGWRVQEVIDAALTSHHERRWVEITVSQGLMRV